MVLRKEAILLAEVIERFWRELWQGCTCTYYELFRTMEQDGILDVDNEVNLLSLHLVFLKRIQSSVDRFVHAVSNRPLRTEHNKTPMQMWIMGQFLDPKIQLTAEESEVYGMDFGIPESVCNAVEESIVVPQLLQVPEVNYPEAEINAILEQPVDTPFEVQTYMDVCSLFESI
ncbi:uncharacterized protein LOC128209106 isoform X3 [Mya arenaria]|uniref:uncharacterized protein LOC128209106 isoform X3 n=1 Tax=Mya arenaria TaxID=6604 RepID=UPI0022E10791|nr:uncharacterized protein LOC128209106 isoform X3 [Mya arenaria]